MRRWLAVGAMMSGMTVAMGQSSYQPAQGKTAESEKVFKQLREDWARNLREKHVDASVAEYAAEGEFIEPDGTRVRGAADLRKLYETVTHTFDSDLVFDSKRVETAGALAYDSGEFREVLTMRATGKRLFSTGSYLTVYRREDDGRWLIAQQVWTGPGPDAMTKLDLEAHPVVALTFDDLPAVGVLPAGTTRTEIATKLAAELNAAKLGGTYGFVNAEKMEDDADAQKALRAWVDAGMNIGSHTWAHLSLSDNPAEAFERQIAQNEPVLQQYAGGRDWHWFRYPFL